MRVPVATLDSIRLGSLLLEHERVVLVPFNASEHHGVQVHGTIGYPLFARYVVQVDYVACERREGDFGRGLERGPRQP